MKITISLKASIPLARGSAATIESKVIVKGKSLQMCENKIKDRIAQFNEYVRNLHNEL